MIIIANIEEEIANRGLAASAKHLSSFNTGQVGPFLLKCPWLLWQLNNRFLNNGNGKSFCLVKKNDLCFCTTQQAMGSYYSKI
jgi:hypothetical protein